MKVIFARHGETVFGSENRFEGTTDSPLTEKGEKQAKILAEFCKKSGVGKIYSSPLGRARKTSDIISRKLGLKIRIVNDLREACYGRWEGKRKGSLDQKLLRKRRNNLFEFVNPGSFKSAKGESYKDLFERLKPFFKELEREKETIVVVSHLGVIRCAKRYFENTTDLEINSFRIPNNCVYIIGTGNRRECFSASLIEVKY